MRGPGGTAQEGQVLAPKEGSLKTEEKREGNPFLLSHLPPTTMLPQRKGLSLENLDNESVYTQRAEGKAEAQRQPRV